MATNWPNFGQHVRARRRQLGLRQIDIERLGGPGELTIRKMESGKAPEYNYSVDTLRNLAQVFRWEFESFDRLHVGLDPIVIEAPRPQAVPTIPDDITAPMVTFAKIASDASTAWIARAQAQIAAGQTPEFPDGEIGDMLKVAYETFREGGADKSVLARMVAWWQMMAFGETEAAAAPFPYPAATPVRRSA